MPSNHELIAAIYAATLSPNDFEATFDRLDALIFPDQGSSIAAVGEAGAVDSVALAHIDIARNIQRRIGQAVTQDQKSCSGNPPGSRSPSQQQICQQGGEVFVPRGGIAETT